MHGELSNSYDEMTRNLPLTFEVLDWHLEGYFRACKYYTRLVEF